MPALVWGQREPLCCHPLLHVVSIFVPYIKAKGDITHYIGLFIYLVGWCHLRQQCAGK